MTTRFHDTFVYPHNLAEVNKVNSSLFSENCQGNIDVTRTFVGRELNTEYVFGSFAQVGKTKSLNLLGVPMSWNMTHWVGFQNNVNFAATFQMFIPVLNVTLPLEIWSWLSFNVCYSPSNILATLMCSEESGRDQPIRRYISLRRVLHRNHSYAWCASSEGHFARNRNGQPRKNSC